jgi:LysR family cyn operon transcriptional activator
MDFRQVRYFTAIAEQLSFSRASEKLNISQSALSRQMHLLEDELGVRLFDRIGRGIALTQSGHDLLPGCRAILNDVESLTARAAELAGGSAGRLRVGATPQTLESVVSRFLPAFRRDFPDIQIILIEGGSARLAQQLEQGDLDLAIAGRAEGSILKGRNLFPLAALAVVPRGSPHLDKHRLEVEDLAPDDLLVLRRHFMTRQLFDGACQTAGVNPKILIESASPHCLLAFVEAGMGTAIVPSTMLLGALASNAIPLVRDGQQLGLAMSVLWDPRRYMPPPAQAFVETLAAATRHDFPGQEFVFTPFAAPHDGTP